MNIPLVNISANKTFQIAYRMLIPGKVEIIFCYNYLTKGFKWDNGHMDYGTTLKLALAKKKGI